MFVDLSAAAAAAAAGQSSRQHNDDVDMDVDDDDDESDVSDVCFVIVSSFSDKQLSVSSSYADSGHRLGWRMVLRMGDGKDCPLGGKFLGRVPPQTLEITVLQLLVIFRDVRSLECCTMCPKNVR